ncbi:4Fe-4S dicluster domain-containing protein [Dysgonomonas sp. 520]|uniref:4Fe-4S dicluster domain-containing protein n=1 Tax=Dysgonomonas sp. 520 TaxID=2302931 RepID=UPI0013D7B4A8|nr:4Fe-4S dicluster domain-containing protein [Dysgonomonas sp. 520]NDW09857.1 hypothetical protein [Dysgonomonas sp. 520]
MAELNSKVKELFEKDLIDIFIGYEEGTRNPRPYFAYSAQDADNLVFNDKCQGNLAVYLTRKDLVGGKRVGISASYFALKSISQLFDENQLKEDLLIVLGMKEDGSILEFKGLDEIRTYLSEAKAPSKQKDDELLKELSEMSQAERWQFWSDELSKCFKCYACRAACPMCYCTKCIIEVNRPQWIQPWISTQGNMEWQINRVMHMAGRCSDCGSCGAACPIGIPIHLLTHMMTKTVAANFGESNEQGNVLSTFKPDDKENFIL